MNDREDLTPEQLEEFKDLVQKQWQNGAILYAVTEPEFIGRMPVRKDLPVLSGPPSCLAEKEMAKHGSVALRVVTSDREVDNTIDASWTLAEGGTVLVRAAQRGFYMVPLQRNKAGWFVRCGTEDIPVVWSDVRQRWVVERIPGTSTV